MGQGTIFSSGGQWGSPPRLLCPVLYAAARPHPLTLSHSPRESAGMTCHPHPRHSPLLISFQCCGPWLFPTCQASCPLLQAVSLLAPRLSSLFKCYLPTLSVTPTPICHFPFSGTYYHLAYHLYLSPLTRMGGSSLPRPQCLTQRLAPSGPSVDM